MVVCLVPMPRIAHVLHVRYMAPGKPRRPQYQGVINDEVVTSTEFGTGFPGGGIDVVEMMLENWLEEYRQEQWTFNSLGKGACAFSVYVVDVNALVNFVSRFVAALYGEIKLTEALQLTSSLGVPNDFVTALACNLLGASCLDAGCQRDIMTDSVTNLLLQTS